jgi:hypothetical protein
LFTSTSSQSDTADGRTNGDAWDDHGATRTEVSGTTLFHRLLGQELSGSGK